MEKQKKILIISSVLLVLFVGILVLTNFLPKNKVEEDESTLTSNASEAIKLVEKSEDEISSITIKNSLGEFTVTQEKNGDNINYGVQDLKEDEEIQETSIEELFKGISQIKSTKIVSNTLENKETYGFDNSQEEILISFKDGNTESLIKGMNAPLSQGAYVIKGGKNEIYLISIDDMQFFDSSRAVYARNKSDKVEEN